MKDLKTVPYHKTSEDLVQVLCAKTQNNNPQFFRVMVSYYFAKLASMQRVMIQTHDRGQIPVNIYALNLAPSGYGKGHSTNIVEENVINQFRTRFLEETFPRLAEKHCQQLANKRALRKQTDPNKEFEALAHDFKALGPLLFSFDSGTTPAVKQMRTKLLLADAGSMNLEIDEIGSNLLGQTEVLNAFLELYDVGKIKQKLVKNTAENQRSEEIDGRTPANMMMYGTPAKLLDGGKTEEEMWSFMETGYGRRCLFGYSTRAAEKVAMTPEQVYQMLTDTSSDTFLDDLSDHLGDLADITNYGRTLTMTKEVMLVLIEYKMACEKLADEMPEHEDIRKSEMSHRYFKALKLAGTYAFVDETPEITEDQLYSAIKQVEESGESVERLMSRDRAYVKLAKYIAKIGHEVTHADMMADLPFFKGTVGNRNEMIQLATAWGYKNNVIIKKQFQDGIEFLSGESLQETDLNKIIVAWSGDIAYGYKNELAPWNRLDTMLKANGLHWVNHHLEGGNESKGHRTEDKAIAGFNTVVLDVEKSVTLDQARELLKDYKAVFYTTKRHTATDNRFRVVIPLNYTLHLNAEDYREFMEAVFQWLPFSVDDATGQRARKWLANPAAQVFYQDGKLLDALPFIPKTSKNEERKKQALSQQSLTNLERWFLNNTGNGNRSNQMIKYAMMLVDQGASAPEVEQAVLELNDKLADKMSKAEIKATILRTAGKAIAKRDAPAA